MNDNPLINTLIALSGQDEVIVVHRVFVHFTGSIEAAMMLNQLLYWTPKSHLVIDDKAGWIARTDQGWQIELMLSRYAVRLARETLQQLGLIETAVYGFSGAPTVHYRVKVAALIERWTQWLQKRQDHCLKSNDGLSEIEQCPQDHCLNSDDGLSENERSNIKTTIETTVIENTTGDRAAGAARPSPSQPALLTPDPDETTAFNGAMDIVFQEALKTEAKADGRRGPQKWGSLEQKKQFRSAAQQIVAHGGEVELQRAITEGLKRERKSRDTLVSWLVAWAGNLGKPKPQPRAGTAPPSGPAYTREQARQWYGRQ